MIMAFRCQEVLNSTKKHTLVPEVLPSCTVLLKVSGFVNEHSIRFTLTINSQPVFFLTT